MAAVTITSLVRARLGHRSWRAVHLLSWLAWASAAVHAVGIGTDLDGPGGLAVVPAMACLAAVLLALRRTTRPAVADHRPATAWERSA